MKKTLAASALVLTGIMSQAADNPPSEPQEPLQPYNPIAEGEAIVATNRKKFDLAPHLTGTRDRRRAQESGAAIELEL